MQRGKYPVKDVEASFQGTTAEAGYDKSFKMCMITIGVFLMICIILLLCTLPFTSHEPMRESQPRPQPDTGAHRGGRPVINGAENPSHQPVSEEDNESHITNTNPGHRKKISNTVVQTPEHKVTTTEKSSSEEENVDVHTAAENGKDSKTNLTHHEPPVIADGSSEDEYEYSEEYELENVPQREGTITKKNETLENEERKPEQSPDVITPVIKDNSSVSEQERTSTQRNETLDNEKTKPEQSPGVITPDIKDNSSVSEQERTSTKKNETSENEEVKPIESSDVSTAEAKDNSTLPEQEGTPTKKNETSENEEGKPKQLSDVSTVEEKDNVSEQEGTLTKKNETSENEEGKSKQLSDVSTVEEKDNVSEQEGTLTKKNETSENEEMKPTESSDVSTAEAKDNSTLPEQEGTPTKKNETSENEERKPKQLSDVSTVEEKDNVSEQEGTLTKKNETSENEEGKSKQLSDVSTVEEKDNVSEEGTLTKKNETSENEEMKPTESSDVSTAEAKDNSTLPEQEGTPTKKNETSENEEGKPKQLSVVSTVEEKDNVSEQEGTLTKKNETSENEEVKPTESSDVSTAEAKDNSTLPEQEVTSIKKNETSETEERKPKLSSDDDIDEAKHSDNETENIGENKTSRAEEEVAVTWMKEHYKEREHDFNYETTASWPLFHYQKNDSDSVVYGCYGFVEPKGKVRSTYYIYDSSGYHAVTPQEQFEVILGPLKADNEMAASDERDAEVHQRDKRKVKQWNYHYFLNKCGQPLPIHREATEITTGSSSTVDTERSGIQEKEVGSAEGILNPPKPSNASENDQNPGDKQPPGHEEGSDVTQEPAGGSAETSSTPGTSHKESQQVTPEPPKSSNVSGNGGNSVDKLPSGHERGSVETSDTLEASLLENQVTPEPPKPSNASGYEQNIGHEGNSGVQQNSGASAEISSTPQASLLDNQQVTPASIKPSNVPGNEENHRVELSPDHDEGSGVPQKSGESVEITSTQETSHLDSQQVTPEPPNSYNGSGDRENPGYEQHEGGSVVSQNSGTSPEISNSPDTSNIETPESPKPSNASGNEQLAGHEGGSSVSHNPGASAEISSTPEKSLLDIQQATPEPAKPSSVSGNEQKHGDELSADHGEGSGLPRKAEISAKISSTPGTSVLGSQQVTSEPPKTSNTLRNGEGHGDEQSPGHEGDSGVPPTTGESPEISSVPETSNLESQQVTPEPPKPFNVSRNEENPKGKPPPDHDEGSGIPQTSVESTEISSTLETSHLDSKVTSGPSKPSNTSGNGENPGDQASTDNEEGSGVPEKGGSVETSSTPEASHLELTQEPLIHSNVSSSFTHEEVSDVLQKSGVSTETSGIAETMHLENQQNKTESVKPTNEEEEENGGSSADASIPENLMALPNNVDSQEASYPSGWTEGLIA